MSEALSFFKRLDMLLKEKGMKYSELSQELGINKSTISMWKKGVITPKTETIFKIADYFGVSPAYLMGWDTTEDDVELTPKDERDIAKDIDNIMVKLSSGEAGPASYNGKELTPEAAELFRDEIEIALKRLKIINKEKYSSKKHCKNTPD